MLGWEKYAGDGGILIGMDRFGASAPYQQLYGKFGLTVETIVASARQAVERATS